MTRDQLFDAALELAEDDRLELATRLMETVPSMSSLWEADDERLFDELDRRAQDGSPPISWADVRAELEGS